MTRPTFVNVAAHLPEMARTSPETLAVADPLKGERWNFRELNQESDTIAAGLRTIGIDRGVRTVLMVKPSLEFFALTFALFKLGAVPVLVDPGMGVRNLGQCLDEAKPEAFIGIPKAHAARVLLGWGRRTVRRTVTVGTRLFWGGYTLQQIREAGQKSREQPLLTPSPDEMAAILFTSGSTGIPKGAVYTHGIFSSQVDILRRTFGIQPGEIDLCTFPLFALFAPALGMTAIIPDMDASRPGQVDPKKIVSAIEQFGVTNMFGSPALLRRVGQYSIEKQIQLPTLRRLISAGAPVPAEVLEQFQKLLPEGVQVFTPYGATEALPVCSIGSDEILRDTRQRTAEGAGVCVGRPVEGMRVRIIRISDAALPSWTDDLSVHAGEIGEIVVQGPVVTREYYNRHEATRLAKIVDPASGLCHRMGDLGYFDDQGRLWFCGRKSHRVVTPAETLFTIPCEAVFNVHPKVLRTALVGIGMKGSARPVLCVELRNKSERADPALLKKELAALGQKFAHTRSIDTFLIHPAFPVDIRHNSKIFREKLALWAAKELA